MPPPDLGSSFLELSVRSIGKLEDSLVRLSSIPWTDSEVLYVGSGVMVLRDVSCLCILRGSSFSKSFASGNGAIGVDFEVSGNDRVAKSPGGFNM